MSQKMEAIVTKSLIGVSVIFLLITTIVGLNSSIWMDEAYSLNVIKQSYKEIIALGVNDCHPPLYHIMLKAFISMVSIFNSKINVIVFAKVFSIIPIYLILIIFNIYFKSKVTKLHMGIFSICIVMMPNILVYSLQIRMYSWAFFFVTMELLMIYAILFCEKKWGWAFLIIFALAASYTHYFACVTSAGLFFFLFLYQIISDRKKIRIWCIIIGAGFLGFSPWLSTLLKKLISLSENGIWITPISIRSLIGYLWFVFFPQVYKFHLSGILGTLFCCILMYAFIQYLTNKAKDGRQKYFVLMGPLCLLFTLIVGIIASLLIAPVFCDRFLFPSIGCLWFCICATLVNIKSNRIKVFICMFVVLIGVINGVNTITAEIQYKDNLSMLESKISSVYTANTVFVSDSFHLAGCISYYNEMENRDSDTFLWLNKADGMTIMGSYHNLFYRLDNMEQIETVKKIYNEKANILFLENIGYNSDFINKCKTNNMEVNLLGKYSIEDRTFNLYQIDSDN